MKKLISIILIIMMILGAVACNSTKSNESKEEVKETEKKTDSDTDGEEVKETEKKTDSDTDGEEVERKPFKIGFSVWGTSDSHGRYVSQAASWVEELGGEVIVDVAQGFTIDAQVASIENLIQSGADIVSFCAYSGEAVIPKISELAEKNEVYFVMWDTTVSDPAIQEMVDSNPYFVGTTNEGQFEAGYETVEYLAEQGATDFVIIKYAIGVAICDERVDGASKAIDDLGLNLTYVIEVPEDTKKAVEDTLVNYPEVNAVVAVGGTAMYVTPSIQAIESVGRKGEVLTSGFDFSDTMGAELEAGDLSLVLGGHVVTTHFANLMALSAYWGDPINPDKEQLMIPYLTVTSPEDIDNFNKYVVGDVPPYTPEEMLDSISSDKTFDDFQKIAMEYSIEDVISRRGE
ncbi:MAG: substrate-binding domain-containing protein [Clostridiaceae bacterium]|nr:substrate-binding domain-containing protein [Clostridiaceae bacterium]